MKFSIIPSTLIFAVLGLSAVTSLAAPLASKLNLGAEAEKFYEGDGISIGPLAEGAELRVTFQKLTGQATPAGLWLTSSEESSGENRAFRVMAEAVGREGGAAVNLPQSGFVEVADEVVRLVRSGVIEEYRVSMDGVRQDFVVVARPPGSGALRVDLSLDGATALESETGVTLTLAGSGREITYSRLLVTDATDRELPAHFEVGSTDALALVVDDGNAVYPVRIDPTFSDANWGSIGPSGASNTVVALAMDGLGNLFAGGRFTTIGGVTFNRIAKWDGSNWSALGSGMNSTVRALAVSGTDLYAAGVFTSAGGVAVNRIAKWDGISWSALGLGVGPADSFPQVNTLAVSGNDVYAGGIFATAGAVPASNIAKWDGMSWSALGSGTDGSVDALETSGSDLYVGGLFITANELTVNNIAKWDGSTWSALGSGMNLRVNVLAASGTELFAGGEFTAANGVEANHIAKWGGGTWSPLGDGMNSTVEALTILGPDLYVGGYFTMAGGGAANRIARWDGSSWSALGSGTNNFVSALVGSGTELYVGGGFTEAGGQSASFIAQADLSGNPEIVVEQPTGNALVDGTAVVDFGDGVVGSLCADLVVTVRNTGDSDLTGLGITIDGANAADFSVVSSPVAPVIAGGSTTFTVSFGPTAIGVRNAVLHIASNDVDEGPFDVNLTGNGATARALFDAAAAAAGLLDADAEPDAIPFDDGISNLMKYAFNISLAAVGGFPMTPGGLGGLPIYSIEVVEGQNVWRLEFVRRKGCRAEYLPMHSTTLDNFTFVPMTGPVTVTDIDGEWERVIVDEPFAPHPASGFSRITVTLP